MSIGEAQLETWSKVGSLTQSKDTYAIIRNSLNTAPVRVPAQCSSGEERETRPVVLTARDLTTMPTTRTR